MSQIKERIAEYFEQHKEQMIKSLAELVAIDSSFKPGNDEKPFGEGSAAALAWAQAFARENGFITTNYDNYAIDIDFDDKEQVLAILSHLDVVPASKDGWHSDPFTLTERDGVLYGRGTIDDKGPSIAVLYAMKCIKELGIPLKKGFRAVMGGNEERGCNDIVYYQQKRPFPKNVFTPDGSFPVLNCEKGLLHIKFSKPFADEHISSIKGGISLNAIPERCEAVVDGKTVVSAGKAAHGSRPENGDNAITKFLSVYDKDGKIGLGRLFPHGECDGKSCGMGFSDKVSGTMTCALTLLNTEGGRLHGGVDIRYPIDKTLAEITEMITAALQSAGFEVDSCEGFEPHYVDEKSDFVQKLLKVYEDVLGEKGECISEGGITYVHNTEGGVAFGAEFPDEQNNMHGADEHISLETFMINCNMYANAIVEICG
ncbi:Sapep family Mn(2+)-dependent dipeptidase [Ruminococcus sp. NK3A76]|uniref:Sapep family Mn(2+)-dependent dipeptidase n=1 Tax=Ruminococcus sp. NK3A76 TaxID=877411 RepID=UPI00048CD116|nr:Sapep family Mn(2+)-dependent dipeptidase [Ruminococcus sp. NK3A76]